MSTAVLLPLRLETRFDGSRLRIRIIPDEPWYDRHDPLPTAAELAALERYLAVAGEDRQRPEAREAWRAFATQHGPGRASWLVRNFPPQPGIDPVRVARPPSLREEEVRFTELTDFPDRLQVWLARGGGPPALAAETPIDPARLRVDLPDPDQPDDPDQPYFRRWWDSWDEAVLAGLATEIDLGQRPDDIDALYVVGLAATSPAALFTRHRDAGQLALLAPGTPTNTVDGRPARDLAQDPMPWLELFDRGAVPTERQVSLALTGDSELLGPLPGDPQPYQRWARLLLTGLWPALLGHSLGDVLGLSQMAAFAANWAQNNLDPIGPYPTLRIGSQPYGILPATSLASWVATGDDPRIEAAMREPLILLRQRWAREAIRAGRGAIQGASAEHLLELLAQPPASPEYTLRLMHPIELWQLAVTATNHSTPWPQLIDAWQRAHPVAGELGLRPQRRYGSRGGTRRLRLPLVTPRGAAEEQTAGAVLRKLADTARDRPSIFATTTGVEEAIDLPLDSLLLRLAIRSLQVAIGEFGRHKLNVPAWRIQPIAVRAGVPPLLSDWVRAVEPTDLLGDSDRAVAARRVIVSLRDLRNVPDKELERLLPAVLDCSTHRIDPWLTGFARRRMRRRPEEPPQLGAYGWVDRPRPGQPGPTAGGLLHAPSHPQALTAALIRDRAISDPEPDRWHMDITSERARLAARLADEVRGGAHPAEALGREVERVVANPSQIRTLRKRFPLRGEHAGRRTCNGLRLLAANPTTLGLPTATLAALDRLRATIDVYGDLLVAEAVHHVVEGRTADAGAALDAAAGLARPPMLDVLQTRREGRPAETSCLIVISSVETPPLPDGPALAAVSPARIADPSCAAFIAAQVGAAADWRWRLAGSGGGTVTVSLGDLDLTPADALALPRGTVERLVLESAGDPGATFTDRDGSDRYDRGVRLIAVLGRTPATAVDTTETTATPPGVTAAVAADLRARLADLRTVAEALGGRLAAAIDADQRRAALRLAAAWGIAPEPDPTLADPLAGQVGQAVGQLGERLAAAPDESAASALDEARLAVAIAALASPTGQLAVLARLRRDTLPALQAAEGLDADWLAYVAPVRPPLARLEALQLSAGTPAGSGPPLMPWTNRRADPWQRDPEDPRRLVVAYAPRDLDLGGLAATGSVAVGLLDRFAETIPSAGHTTTAAFGFDAPGARAPQAILLAVSPDPAKPLDGAALVSIVAETRELARARMATLADIDGISGLAPLAVVPVTGATASRLER